MCLHGLERVQRYRGTSVGGMLSLQHSHRRLNHDRDLFRVACQGKMQQTHGPSSQPRIPCTRQLLPYQGCSGCLLSVHGWGGLGLCEGHMRQHLPAPLPSPVFGLSRSTAAPATSGHRSRLSWPSPTGATRPPASRGCPPCAPAVGLWALPCSLCAGAVSAEHGLHRICRHTLYTSISHGRFLS